jgi:diketogulonate reductase-like aldo/keto reductase
VTHQSKFNPYHRGRTGNAGGEDFLTAGNELGIVTTAYCPLNDWPSKLKAVDDAHVAHLASKLGKTPAQVILRWAVQLGLTVLTRSSKEARLMQATQIWDFSLGEQEMALVSGLAWFALQPSNRVPETVVDAYGVQALDAAAHKAPHASKQTAAQPIKACDMAWSLLGVPSKVEL